MKCRICNKLDAEVCVECLQENMMIVSVRSESAIMQAVTEKYGKAAWESISVRAQEILEDTSQDNLAS